MTRIQYLTPQELNYSTNGIENLFSGPCLDLNTMQKLSTVAFSSQTFGPESFSPQTLLLRLAILPPCSALCNKFIFVFNCMQQTQWVSKWYSFSTRNPTLPDPSFSICLCICPFLTTLQPQLRQSLELDRTWQLCMHRLWENNQTIPGESGSWFGNWLCIKNQEKY